MLLLGVYSPCHVTSKETLDSPQIHRIPVASISNSMRYLILVAEKLLVGMRKMRGEPW